MIQAMDFHVCGLTSVLTEAYVSDAKVASEKVALCSWTEASCLMWHARRSSCLSWCLCFSVMCLSVCLSVCNCLLSLCDSSFKVLTCVCLKHEQILGIFHDRGGWAATGQLGM